MPWRLEFSNVEQKDLGDLPEISMFSEVSLFFGKISVKGRLNWCFFHEDELFFLLFKTLIKSSKKSSSGLACKLLICGMDSCRKSWGFSELVALGNKKTSLVPLIFFEAQATEEMWAYIADSMKFVTNSQISDTKVDWSVIYSNLIHLERCKRYTFWTLKNTWWFSVPEIEPHSVEGQKLPPIGRSHVDHWIMRFKSVLSLTNLKLFLLLLYPNLWKMYQLDNAYNTHKWGHRSINPKHFAANTNCSRNGHLECIVFFHSSRPPNLAWTLLWWDAACRALCSWKIEMDGQTQCKERSKKWRPSELTGCRRYSAIGHPRSGRSSETIKSEV